MSNVNSWDQRTLVVSEATFRTVPTPSSVADFGGRTIRTVTTDLGPAEVGEVRAERDRHFQGRGATRAFVEGRVTGIPWSIELSSRARATAATVPEEKPILRAGGLKETIGASVTYAPSATPIESGDLLTASLQRFLGSGAASYSSEVLAGCIATQLRWEGGDKELTLMASGLGAQKWQFGSIPSITLGDGSGTSLTHTAQESFLLGVGYYLCESEIIRIATAPAAGATSTTIARAQLGTTGAAHAAKALVPYVPPTSASAGAPISEATSTVTIDGVTVRCISFFAEIATGLDFLPGETGSKWVQGTKYMRYGVQLGCRLALKSNEVGLLNKATRRPTVAVALSQGTAGGGLFTFTSNYCEVEPFAVPDTDNDVAVVDVTFRVRDSTGNDSFSIVYA